MCFLPQNRPQGHRIFRGFPLQIMAGPDWTRVADIRQLGKRQFFDIGKLF
jgi:hypothetical protein